MCKKNAGNVALNYHIRLCLPIIFKKRGKGTTFSD